MLNCDSPSKAELGYSEVVSSIPYEFLNMSFFPGCLQSWMGDQSFIYLMAATLLLNFRCYMSLFCPAFRDIIIKRVSFSFFSGVLFLVSREWGLPWSDVRGLTRCQVSVRRARARNMQNSVRNTLFWTKSSFFPCGFLMFVCVREKWSACIHNALFCLLAASVFCCELTHWINPRFAFRFLGTQ